METLFNLIADNFWVIALIITLLITHRVAGLTLLLVQIFVGFVPWVTITMVGLVVIWEGIVFYKIGMFKIYSIKETVTNSKKHRGF